jgi:hypothetical protein
MKNLTKIGLVLALIFGFTSTLSAGNVRVEKDFIKTIMDASKHHSLKKLSGKIEGKSAYALKYTDYATDAFDKLEKDKKKSFTYKEENSGLISLTANSDIWIANRYGYQCVGLVKAVSRKSMGGTSSWVKGASIVTRKPRVGYVIATFNSKGKYVNDGHNHVAIVLAVKKDYIVVIDQNWLLKGEIYIHAIDFKGTYQNNASNYHIVRYP